MAIRKNRETNAVLTRLNSELQQQLKVRARPGTLHVNLGPVQAALLLPSGGGFR